MNDRVETAREPSAELATDFDAIVIGAGPGRHYRNRVPSGALLE
jgi:hypothetical protein